MRNYLIGTGGWAYFQVLGQHPLVAYSKAFDFVEVNSTFYKLPDPRLVESWRTLVPPEFEFSVRCHRALSHKFKFQPTTEAHKTLTDMIDICDTLKAEILHIQTPPKFQPTKTNAELIRDFISSANLKSHRIALEIRSHQPISPAFINSMRDLNMIHSTDLSKDEELAYKSDILYSRLFGKGFHNIYQPTDDELKTIDRKASERSHKKAAVSFHFTKMYKDATRLKIYKNTGEFPMVTKSVGSRSLAEVLQEDAQFPSSRNKLIRHQGWKLIDFTEEKRMRASELLEKLPEKTYSSPEEVVRALG
ncbi:MAG: DUF72 domain-containing protein [Candidatus Bathyarchaeota archaeon]|nr:MAG: DUF72 domain-containing protein [Candidatus Bathyarchaeota archaeon]